MEFNERVVIVTGASGNLGRAVVKAFQERGARMVLFEMHREHLEQAFGSETEGMRFAALEFYWEHRNLISPSSQS